MTTCVPMLVCSYFYPRPPRGGRLQSSPVRRRGCLFLSTPSARRATIVSGGGGFSFCNFYPRPPRGGRPTAPLILPTGANFYPRPPRGGRLMSWNIPDSRKQFLSTPSARRATDAVGVGGLGQLISIHALREEGDMQIPPLQPPQRNFYPRPPRGGRPFSCQPCCRTVLFLSTPSARRATAHSL